MIRYRNVNVGARFQNVRQFRLRATGPPGSSGIHPEAFFEVEVLDKKNRVLGWFFVLNDGVVHTFSEEVNLRLMGVTMVGGGQCHAWWTDDPVSRISNG